MKSRVAHDDDPRYISVQPFNALVLDLEGCAAWVAKSSLADMMWHRGPLTKTRYITQTGDRVSCPNKGPDALLALLGT